MSFIVSIQGQFSPYIYKVDTSTKKIQMAEPIKRVNEFDDALEMELDKKEDSHAKSSIGIKTYNQQEKTYQRLKKKNFARDIMSKQVVSIQNSCTVEEAARLMQEHGFRHLIVMKQIEIIGILSAEKLLHQKRDANLQNVVEEKMILGLDSTRVSDIAHLMLDEKINALPILDAHHKLVGIITLTDILKFVVQLPDLYF